jgi:hypothetical protein
MRRVYRLSKIGPKLPRNHSYCRAETAAACQPGFEVFIGPIYSIANTVGPALGSLGEGDFTPAAGYGQILLIDVRACQVHSWNPFTWLVILPHDVEEVRGLAISDLHSWLREQPECIDSNGRLVRDAVVKWVRNNLALVESWLDQHSQQHPVEFTDTIGAQPRAPEAL